MASWSSMVIALRHWKFARRASWPKDLFVGSRSELTVMRKGEQDRLLLANAATPYTEPFVPTDQDRNADDWERYVRG